MVTKILTTGLYLIIFSFGNIRGQKFDSDKIDLIRNVTIDSKDSIQKIQIIDKPLKNKIIADVDYFWYYNNQINKNTGGYFGKLLHGKYRVFSGQGQMITDGNFSNGIKSGTWKNWYLSGTIRSIQFYKNGKLNGESEFYNSHGKLFHTLSYKDGKLHGMDKWYYADTVIVNRYKKGNLIVKRNSQSEKLAKTNQSRAKESSVKREDKKGPKLFPVDPDKDTVTQKKPRWYQHIFTKRKSDKKETK